MAAHSAVIFIPNDTARTGSPRPMMLQRVMGTPLLTWLTYSLANSGVTRCFLVCHSQFAEEARACFPEHIALTCAADQDAADLLHVFLSTAEEEEAQVLVITGPAVYVPRGAILEASDAAPTGVYTVSRQTFMSVLDEKFSFMDFLARHGVACTEEEGFFSVSAPDELADWQPILKRLPLYALAENGVEIWDCDNCYVEPSVSVGAGTQLLPGTILRGKTAVGKNCTIGPNALLEDAVIGDGTKVNASQVYQSSVGSNTTVGPFAYIRPGCAIGSNIRIGDFVEVKNSVIGDGTKVSHLTYIGDSDVGQRINFGCGTVTVNYDRAKKHRTTIEDDAFIGCNANLVAPVSIGRGAYIAAGSTITDDVPAQALGIARARQNNKKEWATRHKLKEK